MAQSMRILDGLEIRATAGGFGELTPAFSPEVLHYSIQVQSDIREIQVIPRAAASVEAVTVNGAAVRPGDAATVSVGTGDTTIVVSAGNAPGGVEGCTVTVRREDSAPTANRFEVHRFEDPATGIAMGYRLFVPQPLDRSRTYPLVLFLHGAGESGSDNEIQLTAYEGATVWAQPPEQARHPCFVLAPQNPRDPQAAWPPASPTDFGRRSWTSLLRLGFGQPFVVDPPLRTAYAVLQKVMAEYPVDRNRVYGTGLSMGGFGIYALAAEHPQTFAAVVGICGGLDPGKASALASTAVWVFHAAQDPTVSVRFSRDTVEALKKSGRPPRYTEYGPEFFFLPDAHLSWVPAYASAEMREWLFQQARR